MITQDKRFSFNQEWTGLSRRQYVIRFCGERVASAATHDEAVRIAQAWNTKRLAS